MKSQDKDRKGKEITLDVTVDNGRIEDLLRLAVKSDQPPLKGAINFRTKLISAGKGDLNRPVESERKIRRPAGKFTSPEVTAKIETLSRKAQGQPENKDAAAACPN